jgi:hypothetical protein
MFSSDIFVEFMSKVIDNAHSIDGKEPDLDKINKDLEEFKIAFEILQQSYSVHSKQPIGPSLRHGHVLIKDRDSMEITPQITLTQLRASLKLNQIAIATLNGKIIRLCIYKHDDKIIISNTFGYDITSSKKIEEIIKELGKKHKIEDIVSIETKQDSKRRKISE